MSKGRHAYVKRGKLNRHRWTPRKLMKRIIADMAEQCSNPWPNNFYVSAGERTGSIEVLWDPVMYVFTFMIPPEKREEDETVSDRKS